MPAAPASSQPPAALTPPPISPEIRQFYLPLRRDAASAQAEIEKREGKPVGVDDRYLIYEPALLGVGRINYMDTRRNVNEQEDYALLAQAPEEAAVLSWAEAAPLDLVQRDLTDHPEPNARFDKLPDSLSRMRDLTSMQKDLIDHLYRTRSLTLLYSPVLKSYSNAKEEERDFQMRLKQIAREQRDAEVDQVSKRYEDRLQRLQERLVRSQASVEKKQTDAKMRQQEIMVSVGETVLGMFMGRKSMRGASTAISKYRQSKTASMSAEQDQVTVETLKKEIDELQQELQKETADISARWDAATTKFESVPIRPDRTGIRVDILALAWAPHWRLKYRTADGNTRDEISPAYS
jgi:hypothetical protein